jgi:hypothetical protein
MMANVNLFPKIAWALMLSALLAFFEASARLWPAPKALEQYGMPGSLQTAFTG